MNKIFLSHSPLLILLALVVGCDEIGKAKFDEVASGLTNKGPTQIPSHTFNGINSISGKSDTSLTLNWSAQSLALSYVLYEINSGVATFKQTMKQNLSTF